MSVFFLNVLNMLINILYRFIQIIFSFSIIIASNYKLYYYVHDVASMLKTTSLTQVNVIPS